MQSRSLAHIPKTATAKFRREDFKEALENLYLDHEYLINKVDSNVATIVQHFGDEDLYVKVGVGLIICLYGALPCLFELFS